MEGHQRNEKRSLLLHRAVASRLQDPGVLTKARQRVEGWRRNDSVHPQYVEAWLRLLALDPQEISKRLVDPDESMNALRQCSPFAGALAPRERWQILRQARENQDR